MKLIYPSVELWEQNYLIQHVAHCARICYASESKDENSDVRLIQSLENKGHLSMFRHESRYFIVRRKNNPEVYKTLYQILREFKYCPFISYSVNKGVIYISTNGQFYRELSTICPVFRSLIFDSGVTANDFRNTGIGYELMRYTFCVITQIGTSRELNRTSPNNIAEQSTRYVDFGKKGGITICLPHWWDNASWFKKTFTKIGWKFSELMYYGALKLGFKPEDARGFLPLETATKVVYTYNIDEWKHILNLRFYGVTGKPHPNAKVVAYKILTELRELGYEL